jgi:hypothetical protein
MLSSGQSIKGQPRQRHVRTCYQNTRDTYLVITVQTAAVDALDLSEIKAVWTAKCGGNRPGDVRNFDTDNHGIKRRSTF